MGMRFDAAIAVLKDNDLEAIADRCRSFLPFKHKPTTVRVVSMQSANPLLQFKWLELTASPPRRTKLNIDSAFFETAVIPQNTKTPAFESFEKSMSYYESFFLAKCVSEVCQRSAFIVYSDILCCSGLLEFESGQVIRGEVYGLEGDERLVEFKEGIFESKQMKLDKNPNYSGFLERQITERIWKRMWTEDFLESYYGSGSTSVELPLMPA
jgi:hypothetical protein